jgi:hypothetical protein
MVSKVRRATVIAWLVVAVAGTTPATAMPTYSDRIELGLAVAHTMWPDACYPVTVHTDLLPPPNVPPDSLGWAVIAPTPAVCEIWLSRKWGPKQKSPTLCTAIVHEVGHLYGLPHSDDPASVMQETPTFFPNECVYTWPMLYPHQGRCVTTFSPTIHRLGWSSTSGCVERRPRTTEARQRTGADGLRGRTREVRD